MKKKITGIAAVAVIAIVAAVTIGYYTSCWERHSEAGQPLELPFNHPDISHMEFPAEGQYCLACHQGIEPARPLESEMMKQILELGAGLGGSQRLRGLPWRKSA